MVRTFTSIALVDHIGLCAIWIVGTPLVNGEVVVTIRNSTTNLIAVVQIGAIESPRGNLVDTRAAYIAPGQLAPVVIWMRPVGTRRAILQMWSAWKLIPSRARTSIQLYVGQGGVSSRRLRKQDVQMKYRGNFPELYSGHNLLM